jgi:hypothetical protein
MNGRLFWLTFGGAAAVTAVACWVIWVTTLAPLDRALKAANVMKDRFDQALNLTPRISVNQAIVFSQTSPAMELVTAKRSARVRHQLSETWLHSTKEFDIEATFTAQAGFALRDALVVNIPRGARTAEITLPRAKILSMEMSDFQILKDEDGLWNKLKAKDRELAMRALNVAAKKSFASTDLLASARDEAKARITEIVRAVGCEPVFLGEDPGPKR